MPTTVESQGSKGWFRQRCGIITASQFRRVMGGHRGRASYLAQILDDRKAMDEGWWETRQEQQELDTASMAWGKKYEPAARAAYELVKDVDVVTVGFVRISGRLVGGSGDGLVEPDGVIEIKCPSNPDYHTKTLLYGMDIDHIPQVQGMMWISNRIYCDFISYDERNLVQPLYVQRIPRDDQYIGALNRNCALMEEAIYRGHFVEAELSQEALF